MITERGAQASEVALGLPSQEEPEGPRPYLSSTHAGWDGLWAQASHVPREMESWKVWPGGSVMLMLYAGGAIHAERRQAQASWKGEDLYPGDLVLNWGAGPAYEIRWWSLSNVPTQTLDLRLSQELVERVAEEMLGIELARLELVGRTGIRDPLLEQIARALWQELEQPAPAGKLYAQTAAQFLAVHLVRQYASSSAPCRSRPPTPGTMTARQVKQVREFIQLHLGEALSLETIAQQIGFSPYHFARLFRRTMGVTLHQFVLRQRIEQAQWLLRETEVPLVQVALACGFADQSHLNLVFQQHLGCTPRAYRRWRSR